MTKNFKLIKGAISTILLGSVLVGLVFMVSCDNGSDEPEPELYDLSGTYTFNKAILQTELAIPGLPLSLPVGYDITDEMAGGLLAEAPCDNPENGAVELKSSKELFFTCMGETNELKSGTWSINSDTTELNLNLSVVSGDLQLKISSLEIDENNDLISGTIANFPITKTLLAGFLASLPQAQQDAILSGIAEDYIKLINVDIEFKKEN